MGLKMVMAGALAVIVAHKPSTKCSVLKRKKIVRAEGELDSTVKSLSAITKRLEEKALCGVDPESKD